MLEPEAKGLLSEAAKVTLEKDLGVPSEVISILDSLRTNVSSYASEFTQIVDRGFSSEIQSSAGSLISHASYYEADRFKALNISSDDLQTKIYSAEFKTPKERIMEELLKESPYLPDIEANQRNGYWNTVDRLEFESDQWANDQADYLLKPEVKGLLSELAKQCLRDDYGLPEEAIELFDVTRKGYTSKIEDFNKYVERGTSQDISIAARGLLSQAEVYEYKKIDRLVETYRLDMIKVDEAIVFSKIAPKTSAERQSEQGFRVAPMISENEHQRKAEEVVFRAAPMLPETGGGSMDTNKKGIGENFGKGGLSR